MYLSDGLKTECLRTKKREILFEMTEVMNSDCETELNREKGGIKGLGGLAVHNQHLTFDLNTLGSLSLLLPWVWATILTT